MHREVHLTHAPILVELPPPPAAAGAGAWVEFRGVVRGEENGAAIAALEYEAYAPMAEREIHRLLTELARPHPCLAARVIHRLGVIPTGEAAIYVGLAARHRAEAFALLGAFMDRLKQDVPIWKSRAIPLATPPARTDAPASARPEAASEQGPDLPPASAADVLERVRALCPPLEVERIPLAEAVGRVLREAIRASEDQPPFDRAAVDGFAIRADDPAREFQIVDRLRAGDWRPRELASGEAVQIATGAALPGNGLLVVRKEDTREAGSRVTVLRRDADRNIRFRGEDARAGQVLVEPGTVLSAGALALLAAAGQVTPAVTRLPRVWHVATGDEIVPPEQAPAPGQIRDSNSMLVRAFFGQWGITPVQWRVGEDRAALGEVLAGDRGPMDEADLLILSGGASVGDHDFTRVGLEQLGFTVHVHRTTTRPGKPLIVAQRGRTVAFGLPGNPLAHFVCLNLFVRAALEAWSGQSARTDFVPGVLAADLDADAHPRETFWPARWEMREGTARLTPLRWRSSGDLTSLAAANALLRVPPGAGRLARGSRIEFLRTGRD